MRLLSWLAWCGAVAAVDSVVDLGYAKYQGRIVGDGTTQWLGMRYAQAPLGKLRFRAPVEPGVVKGVQDASKFGNICLAQSPDDWSMKPNPKFTPGEDCLFVNVFAPSNATNRSKLPVMFFIQGGGFTSNSNANYNGSDLAKEGNMIVVSINYRVGPYGFLQGKELGEEESTNVGIRDQITALEWTKKHIGKFGGNPDHIVLNGDSAGAMSIVILVAAPAIKNKTLFKGIIAESTALITPKTLDKGQVQYDCLAKAAGCSNNTDSSLNCLRHVNATKLQTTGCSFGPHFDKAIIPTNFLTSKTYANAIASIPSIFGTTQNEGTNFSTVNIDTLFEFNLLLHAACPALSDESLTTLQNMYIPPGVEQPTFPNSGRLWRPASNAVGDIALHCPTDIYAGSKSWKYRFAVRDPDLEARGVGAYHTVELHAIWGPRNADGNPPKSYLPGGVNAHIVPLMRGYVTSFVRWLDPNVGRMEGAPIWRLGGEEGVRLRLAGVNESAMEGVEDERKRCKILRPMVEAMEMEPPAGTKIDL